MRRTLHPAEDPRLPPPLRRRGGDRSRRHFASRPRRQGGGDLSRARPRADPRRADECSHGGNVRQGLGLLARPRRLDASLRCRRQLLRRQRHRRRWPAACRRDRPRRPNARNGRSHGLLLRRGRGCRGRVPRDDEPRRTLGRPRPLRLREQRLCDGHRPRPVGSADRHRRQGRRLRHRLRGRRRHGRGRRRDRSPPRRRRNP